VVCADPYVACRDADAVVVLTEWPELEGIDAAKVAELVRRRAIVDARNVLDRDSWQQAGFDHQGIGR
jgi:UDPglucose 6-dehydrogenase